MSKQQIKDRVRENDNRLWGVELGKLSSVGIYREFKLKIKEEGCYLMNLATIPNNFRLTPISP